MGLMTIRKNTLVLELNKYIFMKGTNMKQIQLRIFPNGELEAETKGMKGKTCLKYIAEIERIANAVTRDSDFTKEYLEIEENENVSVEQEVNA